MISCVRRSAALVPLLVLGLLLTHLAALADDAKPYVDRSSIQITTCRELVYADPPKGQGGDQWEVWKWTPKVDFTVYGPLPAGSACYVEFSKPDGKPWLKLDYDTPEVGAGQWVSFEGNMNAQDGKGITDTGLFPFKIGYKSELNNVEGVLFTGKVKINKFLCAATNLPKFSKQFTYYADQDWYLPIGYLFSPQFVRAANGTTDNEFSAPLECQMWFAIDNTAGASVSAFLFYNGKQIATTENADQGNASEGPANLAPEQGERCCFVRYTFEFMRALVWDKQPEDRPDTEWFHMEKNPGDYEIKVLVNKHLVRDAKFAVGADGKIVDNGLAQKGNVGTFKMLLPVKVSGTEDRKCDLEAYKTAAFWGNPVDGFSAP
jgi:hypothetical protein